MSPRRRKRLWWLVAGAVVALLLAGAAAAVVVMRSGEGDVSNPDVAFEDTTESVPVAPDPVEPPVEEPASRRASVRRRLQLADLRLLEVADALPAGARSRCARRSARRGRSRGRVLLEFTPVLCGRRLFLLKNNGALYAISRLDGRVRWTRKLGSLAAASPACDGDTVYVTLLQRFRGSKGGRVAAVDAVDGRTPLVAQAAEPLRVLAAPRRRPRCTSAPRTARSTRCARPTARCAGGRRPAARSRARSRSTTASCSSATTAARSTRSARPTAARSGRRGPAAAVLGLGGGNFYSSPRSPTAASTSAARTAPCTRSRRATASSPGATRPAATSTPRPPWARARRAADGLHRLLRRHASTRSTRSPAGRAGRGTWAARSPARRAVIGDLVFVSDLGTKSTWALGAGTGATVWKTRPRRVQPGDLRRAAHLLQRLLVASSRSTPRASHYDRRTKR